MEIENKNGLPPHLSHDRSTGMQMDEPIAQYELGTGKNFVYLILDWSQKKAAMVDPQSDLQGMLSDLQKNGFTLESILLTHTHYDHTAGVVTLLKRFPNLEVRVGESDLHRLPSSVSALKTLKVLRDGEMLSVGNLSLSAHHTPRHSAGEFSYFLDRSVGVDRPYLFTGDTIFIRDCGRTDFPDGSNEAMFASIQKVKQFPRDTVFLVGHHYAKECSTTLAREMETSPPFRCSSVDELASLE